MSRKKNKSAMWGRACVTVCLFILSASTALAGSNKISKDLEGKTGPEPIDVIVQYKEIPTPSHHSMVLSRGGRLNRDLGIFKGSAYRVPASALAELAADPDVVYISPDRALHSASDTLDYHNETINSAYAWNQGYDGTGIGVAVIDSGIASVPDLPRSDVVYSQDFTGIGSAWDQYGHGTHVSGILAGDGDESSTWASTYTFQGIAQGVNLVNLRVLDQNGNGTDSEVIAALQTAIQLKSTYNIRVINLSLGRPVFESYTVDPLCQAVEQAWKAGIVVVVAAGNNGRVTTGGIDGYGTITAPGNDPYVITVGAMNTLGSPVRANDVPASYSSKGPTMLDHVVKPDLVAPGNLIISLYSPYETLNQENPGNEIPTSLYLSYGSNNNSPYYFLLSGTSMATPMVSAAAALLLQEKPGFTPDQVKARLMKTAFKGLQPYSTATDPVTGITYNLQADIFTVGAGLLDIDAALSTTGRISATVGAALSPTAVQDPAGNIVLVDGASTAWAGGGAWANSVVWGTSVLWGTDILGNSVLWGSSVVWGTGTMAGNSVLWGSSVLWGTSSTPDASVFANGDEP